MADPNRARIWAAMGGAALLAACSGELVDPPASARPVPLPDDPSYCEALVRDPGRVTLRRLNRLEYNNTVRDLLGDDTRPADEFPRDDVSGDGFDNDGDVLALSPLLLEKYDAAARGLSEAALAEGSEARRRFLGCDPAVVGAEECARSFFREFGLRAYRRPLDADEVERLVAVVTLTLDEEGTYEEGIGLAIRAMLMSPSFLFRVELHDGAGVRELDGYELASRLSYFLWASMPDDELLALAGSGDLVSERVLRQQVDRMFEDPRAEGFYESFAGQWLGVRELEHVSPDPAVFDGWDPELARSMERESLAFVRAVVEEGGSVSTLLDADFTFVDERLARHYGLPGVTGDELRRVPLSDGQRGGVLRLGSVLTVTSHPDTTSPVRRGKWILDQILCEPPPDPPPDVDAFFGNGPAGESTRDRLARHREDPACAVCHDVIDPLGLAFENYDGIGRWRTEDNGAAIDASGELPGGRGFDGAEELAGILERDERAATCVTRKLVTFALGRGLDDADRCYVEDILAAAAASGEVSLRELIVQIVTNDVFRTVGGEGSR